jgi:putative tryptophan/tyrosine transport system substrate-binding protein
MQRREFITFVGAATAALPLAAYAQQRTPVVGFLSSRSPGESAQLVAAFQQGLKETGYLEGRDIQIAFRWAEGRYDRLSDLAAQLVQAQAAVITSVGGSVTALAVKSVTQTIPIVAIASDPVKHGLVASFNRPGGNITVITPGTILLSAKRLELLRELVPAATIIGILANPKYPDTPTLLQDIEEAARMRGQQIYVVTASSEREIDTAFAGFVKERVGAILAAGDPFFDTRRDQIISLAARYSVPTMYGQRDYVVAGGLASYGASFDEAYRQAGIYVGRILKGEKPSDLPVMQSTKFDFVINRKTAKALNLEIPAKLIALADDVVE